MTSQIIEKDLAGQKHLGQHSPIFSPQGTGGDGASKAAIGRERLSDSFNLHYVNRTGTRGSATGELLDGSDPFFVWVYVFNWKFLRSECRACGLEHGQAVECLPSGRTCNIPSITTKAAGGQFTSDECRERRWL